MPLTRTHARTHTNKDLRPAFVARRPIFFFSLFFSLSLSFSRTNLHAFPLCGMRLACLSWVCNVCVCVCVSKLCVKTWCDGRSAKKARRIVGCDGVMLIPFASAPDERCHLIHVHICACAHAFARLACWRRLAGWHRLSQSLARGGFLSHVRRRAFK